MDLKGERGYVVAPPSNHASGCLYRFTSKPETALTSLPEWLIRLSTLRCESADDAGHAHAANGKVHEGERNTFLASAAG